MKEWKILTHDDLDGVVSAVLLSIKLKTNKVKFDTYNHKCKVDKKTVVADLFYHKGCGLWFDHHLSNKINKKVKGKFALEKSCAHIIYNYFDKKFPNYYKELVDKTDKADSGDYNLKDIKNYDKIYLLDRVGFLSPFKNRNENLLFLYKLFNHFRNQRNLDDLFKNKFIKKITDKVKELDKKSLSFIRKKEIIKNKTLVVDSSDKMRIFNPFFIYTKYLKCKYVIIITKRQNKIGILVIFNKFYKTKNISNIGEILKKYGGGGHKVIGGCRINKKDKNKILDEILKQLK